MAIIYNILEIMSDSILREKSKELAKKIVFLTRKIRTEQKEFILTDQLLRAGTSIGANIHEAQYAQSSIDFISKLEIALKECFEGEYWLELLFETDYLPKQEYQSLKSECGIIRKMLIASCKTTKSKIDEL